MKKVQLLILLLGIFTISCNDWLDVSPKTEITVEDLFTTESGFHDALTACYIKMKSESAYGKEMTMGTVEYLGQMYAFGALNQNTEIKISDFQYDEDVVKAKMLGIYSNLFNTVTQANLILKHIDESEGVFESEINKGIIKAEALAIRAFCQFDILRIFGQVPVNATINVNLPYSEDVTKDQIPYYSFEKYVEKIKTDINSAEELFLEYDPAVENPLDELNENKILQYRKFRFNYWAVKAFKARLYLYLGDKENAYSVAKEIIDVMVKEKDLIALAGDDDYTRESFALPSECIFALSNHKLSDYTDKLFKSGAAILNVSTSRLEDELFAGRDLEVNNRFLKGWGSKTTTQGDELPVLMKYIQPEDGGSMTNHNVIPLLRLSEVYLIAMETSTDLSEVNDLYYEYMLARNEQVEDFIDLDAAYTEIENEYRREFIAEGQVFFMYKRKLASVMKWKEQSVVNEENYIVPLPKTELNK